MTEKCTRSSKRATFNAEDGLSGNDFIGVRVEKIAKTEYGIDVESTSTRTTTRTTKTTTMT